MCIHRSCVGGIPTPLQNYAKRYTSQLLNRNESMGSKLRTPSVGFNVCPLCHLHRVTTNANDAYDDLEHHRDRGVQLGYPLRANWWDATDSTGQPAVGAAPNLSGRCLTKW